jgi:hypothetical protein
MRLGFILPLVELENDWLVNLRPDGPLGESKGSSVGNGRECVVASRDLQGGSPVCVG